MEERKNPRSLSKIVPGDLNYIMEERKYPRTWSEIAPGELIYLLVPVVRPDVSVEDFIDDPSSPLNIDYEPAVERLIRSEDIVNKPDGKIYIHYVKFKYTDVSGRRMRMNCYFRPDQQADGCMFSRRKSTSYFSTDNRCRWGDDLFATSLETLIEKFSELTDFKQEEYRKTIEKMNDAIVKLKNADELVRSRISEFESLKKLSSMETVENQDEK